MMKNLRTESCQSKILDEQVAIGRMILHIAVSNSTCKAEVICFMSTDIMEHGDDGNVPGLRSRYHNPSVPEAGKPYRPHPGLT